MRAPERPLKRVSPGFCFARESEGEGRTAFPIPGKGLGSQSQLATGGFLDLLNLASTRQGRVSKASRDLRHVYFAHTYHPPERNQRQQMRGSVSSRGQAQQPGASSVFLRHQQTRASAIDTAPLFPRSFAQVDREHFIAYRQDSNLHQPLQMLQTQVPSPHIPLETPQSSWRRQTEVQAATDIACMLHSKSVHGEHIQPPAHVLHRSCTHTRTVSPDTERAHEARKIKLSS